MESAANRVGREEDEGTARQAIFEFGRIAIATMLIGSANRNRGQAEYTAETAARWAVDDISAYTKKRNVNTFYSNYKKAINQCESLFYLFIFIFEIFDDIEFGSFEIAMTKRGFS